MKIIEFIKSRLMGRKANQVVVEIVSRNNRGRITDRTTLIIEHGGELTLEDEAGGEINLSFYGPNGEGYGLEVTDQPEEKWSVFLHNGEDEDPPMGGPV